MGTLTCVYGLGVVTQLVIGVFVAIEVARNHLDYRNMCTTWEFYFYDFCSLLIVILFAMSYCNIQVVITELPRESNLDQLILKY